jgi:predicted peptidase
MTGILALLAVAGSLLQSPAPNGGSTVFHDPETGDVRYALTVPRGYDPRQPRPLVLALHPGGERFPGYGAAFARQVISPGLRALNAIIVAPDCPTAAWTDAASEHAVIALVRKVLTQYNIDRSRLLVAGFSMGGRGTWFMSSRHSDLFTAAIVMAGSPGNESIDGLARVPTYVIHSRADAVVPFGPTEQVVGELKRLKRTIEFEPLDGVSHYQMGPYVDPLKRAGAWIADRWKK